MIERGNESRFRRQEHAVAKDVSRHVTHANTGERLALNVSSHFAKVPLYRFPSAFCGNAHFLVVVTVTSARCESVAKPEAAPLGDLIGVIRKCCRSLVRGNDKVGIVSIVAN